MIDIRQRWKTSKWYWTGARGLETIAACKPVGQENRESSTHTEDDLFSELRKNKKAIESNRLKHKIKVEWGWDPAKGEDTQVREREPKS